MKVHSAQPNSAEWLQARAGIPTASDFDNIVTPLFAIRTGAMPFSYLARKVAEKWIGGPLPDSFTSIDMEIGQVLEERALPCFELETGLQLHRVGLVTNDEGTIGCSPDALIGDDAGLEAKCPRSDTHVKYLLNGALPLEYAAQVHGSMYVTGRSHWYFMSYCRRMPPFILRLARDEKIMAVFDDVFYGENGFLDRLDDAFEQLVKANGGKLPWHLTPEGKAAIASAPKLTTAGIGGRETGTVAAPSFDVIP